MIADRAAKILSLLSHYRLDNLSIRVVDKQQLILAHWMPHQKELLRFIQVAAHIVCTPIPMLAAFQRFQIGDSLGLNLLHPLLHSV